ncbi:MAG: hypothetical protein AAGB01_11535, partial [Cyanobacteria bacterium P01_F01_bin.42]
AGSIELQAPYFKRLGLDLDGYYAGTINLSIAPSTFRIRQPLRQFQNMLWTDQHPPETFSFCQAELVWSGQRHSGLVYYPHPETKRTHFQSNAVLELLAPELSGLAYGDRLTIRLAPSEIEIFTA